jgi:cell volume regulation protein A
MLFGIVLSSFGFVERDVFVTVSGVMAAVALMIILFDAGLNMHVWKMLKGVPRGTLLAVVGMAISTLAIGGIGMVMGFDLLTALLMGAILGGTSSPIVVSIVGRLHISEPVRALLDIESIITDPLIIVVAISLIKAITTVAPGVTVIGNILAAYSIAIVVGLIVGLIWLFVLQKLRGKPFDYMLTISVLALLFVFVESFGGSGAISALMFGLVLGNAAVFSSAFRIGKVLHVDGEQMRSFHSQITFFIRAFFFVLIGLIATIEFTALLYGIVISIVLILVRLLAVHISIFKMTLTRSELNLIRIMAPRGLAAAVLAGLPLSAGIAGGEIILNITFVVIIATVIYTTVATKIFYKPPEVKAETKPEGKPLIAKTKK